MKRYDYMLDSVAVATTLIQPSVILQYISLILTITATALSIGLTIYNWLKKSREDGKITIDELTELKEIIHDSKEKVDSIKGRKKDG